MKSLLQIYQLTNSHRLILQFKLGLEYIFIDKNKNQRKLLAANLESVCQRVDDEINQEVKEDFPEFRYTDIFMKTVINTKDYIYKNLKGSINNQNIYVISGDKDSNVIKLES